MTCRCVYAFARIFQKPHNIVERNFLLMIPAAVARSSTCGVAIRVVLPVLFDIFAVVKARKVQVQHGFDMTAYMGLLSSDY